MAESDIDREGLLARASTGEIVGSMLAGDVRLNALPMGLCEAKSRKLSEASVERIAQGWLAALGWQVAHGPDIGPMRGELE